MRGQEKKQTSMLVLRSPADFVPKQHPIRRIKKLADGRIRVTPRFAQNLEHKVVPPSTGAPREPLGYLVSLGSAPPFGVRR